MPGTLGLDLGEKRTGIAFADGETAVATPLMTFHGQAGQSFVRELKKLVEEYRIARIVVGLPLDLQGRVGPAAQKITEKVEWLKSQIPAEWVFWDERLTTAEVEWTLIEHEVRRDKRKNLRDQLAAQKILQSYLDHERTKRGK